MTPGLKYVDKDRRRYLAGTVLECPTGEFLHCPVEWADADEIRVKVFVSADGQGIWTGFGGLMGVPNEYEVEALKDGDKWKVYNSPLCGQVYVCLGASARGQNETIGPMLMGTLSASSWLFVRRERNVLRLTEEVHNHIQRVSPGRYRIVL